MMECPTNPKEICKHFDGKAWEDYPCSDCNRNPTYENHYKALNQSNDPQLEGVKAPSEISRSPSNQSSTTLKEE